MIRIWRLVFPRRLYSGWKSKNPTLRNYETRIPHPRPPNPNPHSSARELLAILPRSLLGWLRLVFTLAGQFAWLSVKIGVLAHVVWSHGFYLVLPWGPSMLPTMYVDGERVLVDARYRRGRDVLVGDVVSVGNPIGEEFGVIKRVVGLPGDFVLVGTPERSDLMVQVPAGHCFLAGDNQAFSRDSRHYGPIPMALIQGKVTFRLLPWSRRGWIANTLRPVEEEDITKSTVT